MPVRGDFARLDQLASLWEQVPERVPELARLIRPDVKSLVESRAGVYPQEPPAAERPWYASPEFEARAIHRSVFTVTERGVDLTTVGNPHFRPIVPRYMLPGPWTQRLSEQISRELRRMMTGS